MSRLLTILRPKGGIEWLFLDRFLTDEAAPMVSPRTAQPGPGVSVINDSDNILSVSGGKLVTSGNGAGWGDPRYVGPGLTTAGGLALLFTFEHPGTNNNPWAGWANRTIPAAFDGVDTAVSRDVVRVNVGGTTTVSVSGAVAFNLTRHALVKREGGGTFFLARASDSGAYNLVWVYDASHHATIYPAFSHVHVGGVKTIADMRVLDMAMLDERFATRYGLALLRNTDGVQPAGDYDVGAADFFMEFTVDEMQPTGFQDSIFRYVDATNHWYVQWDSDGAIDLVEHTAGVHTTRGSGADGSVEADKRVHVVANGSTIKVYTNFDLRITYGSATAHQTATDGSHSSSYTSDFVVWPAEVELPDNA